MKSALILIDIQNEYFKGGKSELYRPENAAENAKKALDYFRFGNKPVYHIRHINIKEDSKTFLKGSIGSEIHREVYPELGEKVFIKHVPNSFYQTGLSDELISNDIKHLVICGMMSHMCIDTTVRAAKDLGFSVTVLEDACTTKELFRNGNKIPAETVHNAFMASLSGMFANVMKTDEFLNE